jgi:hypothetical protein
MKFLRTVAAIILCSLACVPLHAGLAQSALPRSLPVAPLKSNEPRPSQQVPRTSQSPPCKQARSTKGDDRSAAGATVTVQSFDYGREKESGLSVSAVVSIVAAVLSIFFFLMNYLLSTRIANRTVTIEAQKMLLEINKQYIQDPDLFAIYDSHPNREQLLKSQSGLEKKIEALGFLKLNVFEAVFAVLPRGSSYGAWKAYFEDSLQTCGVLQEELDRHGGIYHPNLIHAYVEWKKSHPSVAKTPLAP